MTNELAVLRALQKTIQENLNNYIENLDKIEEDSVFLDFPDVDKMKHPTCLYIQPDRSEFENLSTESDYSTFYASVFIISKRDKQENLMFKVYEYQNSLYRLLKDKTDLGNVVDFTEIDSSEFYPAIEGNLNVKGIELSVSIRYTKDY